MEGAGGAQHALQMRGHEGAGCVYSGPAEGVCCRLLFGLFTEVGPPERDKTEGSQELNNVWVRGCSASNRLY